MLGFGKKKKGKNPEEEDAKTSRKKPDSVTEDKSSDEKDGQKSGKKKKFSLKGFSLKKIFSKKLLFILLILIAISVSGYFVYKLYFSADKSSERQVVYKAGILSHVDLPEEMVRFCFDFFPDLYPLLLEYDREVEEFNGEIERINDVGLKYPGQKKIADKEKKVWEKALQTLKKAFVKVETPLRQIYVLFQVNREEGNLKIEEKKGELVNTAVEALAPAKELTSRIDDPAKVPEGFIKGNIYRLKKKFL